VVLLQVSMQQKEQKEMQELNVFIDFEIIEKSDPTSLYKELDLIILAGNKIHICSKTKSIQEMKKYCNNLKISPLNYNKKIHEQARFLRKKDKKTYQEIASTLKISTNMVGFYVKNDPNESWVLSDWIIGYHIKDSTIYDKIDYLVDCDKRLVDKFLRAGRKATFIEKV